MLDIFAGKTIKFRAIEHSDIKKLKEWFNEPITRSNVHISDNIPLFIPFSYKQMEMAFEEWQKDKKTRLIIEHIEDNVSIGIATLDAGWDPHCPGLDLFLCSPYRRKGYGRESIQLLLNYLFNYTLAHVIQIWIADYNENYIKFLETIGFEDNGRMRYAGLINGQPYSIVVMGLLKRNWNPKEGI